MLWPMVMLSSSSISESIKTTTINDLTDAHFYKSSGAETISFVVPTACIRITTQWKTAAFLNRGGSFPVVAAVSGRIGSGSGEFSAPEAGFERLDAAYWMHAALDTARAIGLPFKSDRRDAKGIPGSYCASHAEAQLMSFFIQKNYIFHDYAEGEVVNDDFLQLFMLQPRNQRPQIIVSKEPCTSCKEFAKGVRKRLGIRFEFRTLEVNKKYQCPSCDGQWEARLSSGSPYHCLLCGECRADWDSHVVWSGTF
ncbi:hypothetical protein VTN77DRAFT_1990 [Rasamsonia byssochlamydoides]|uniref:uncharacterized protein n=1 Tax=Rasamsonia byssochlamydoides TaxID=89139 RepID=UPI00374480DB